MSHSYTTDTITSFPGVLINMAYANTLSLRHAEICFSNVLSDAPSTSKRHFVGQKTRNFSFDFEVEKDGQN
jgi:hypothetical protein